MSEPTRKLRWGILGAARVNERLLPAIVEARNSELAAIASRRPGAAAACLARYAPGHGAKTYDALEPLLEDPAVEAVYLPLANQEHAEWGLKALEAGKHLLCEKPMALRVADIEAIERAALERGLVAMEGFMYRFHPQHRRIRDLLDAGVLGDIRSVRATYSFTMRPARMYRIDRPPEQGGGAMWDIGCYAIHSLRTYLDTPPLAVAALAHHNAHGADTGMSGVVDFGGGRHGLFDFSFERARRSEYEIIGTQGGAKCHTVWQLPGDTPVVSWWTEDGREGVERLAPANHFRLEVEHFADCVLEGRTPALALADAKANCRLVGAALRSAATGRAERLD
ncbi:Gfo/Idh/MocA family protein [Methylomagnum ishizawai]|uniref:Gfo/Idh/MocA family protein n=1 Tax=Methylomagnum ishizawai TaxID=1760988 RepID=UPI001C3434B7|nr:Gfo/Idh/MocA family oxidoreductase [Methylomagnum ishizawai]BBL77382.1 deoxyfructose oxidoreductase [Methylomagnum ishizawai]